MALRRAPAAALVCFVGLTACGGGGEDGAGPSATTDAEPALRLPYDVEVDEEGRVYIADGGLHQVLRFDPGTGELSVVAGTGQPGSDGDGGPATAAKVNEPVGLALASDGTLFLSDFPAGRVRRIDPAGTITTLARLRQPAEVALDGAERYLAVPSLVDVLHRVDLATGKIDTLARPEEPHGAAYDEVGDLYFPDGNYIRKLDRRAGRAATIAGNGQREATGDGGPARDAGVDAVKLVVAPDGSLYVVGGDLYGGTVRRISDGTIEAVVGSGTLGPNGDGGHALDAGIQPSDVALAPDGALIVSQIEPEAAIRRVDPATGVITTIVR